MKQAIKEANNAVNKILQRIENATTDIELEEALNAYYKLNDNQLRRQLPHDINESFAMKVFKKISESTLNLK